jgi:hypothetical protein
MSVAARWLIWRPGTCTRPAVRPLRAHDRDRAVRTPRRAGHDGGAVLLGEAGVWVVDNGSSHRGQASADRLEREWANLRLVHLPAHASWLNQIEICFSVVQRKVVSPNDFTDLAEVEARLLAFERRYEQTAAPFDWHFTRSDLDRLLRRLEEHEQFAGAA